MSSIEPDLLRHSWPIWEQPRHFEIGHVLNSVVADLLVPAQIGFLSPHHAGCWECDLTDNSLTWSGGVHDLFGLTRDARISREEAVAFYCEDSRAKMERLRAYAITRGTGFTVDVEIRPATGKNRWMRLIAAPICTDGRAVRLHGLKLAI